MLLYKSSGFLRGLRSFLRSFFRNGGSRLGAPRSVGSFCGGILPLDSLPLLKLGIGIAGGVILFHFLLQRGKIRFVQLFICPGCFPVGFQLMAAVACVKHMGGAFCRLFQSVGRFCAYIVILSFTNLPVKLPPDSFTGGSLDGMGQLGGRLFPAFLELQLYFQLSGFGIGNHICFQLFSGGDLPLDRICLVSSFVCLFDFLAQLRGCAFLAGEFEPGRTLIQTIHHPAYRRSARHFPHRSGATFQRIWGRRKVPSRLP